MRIATAACMVLACVILMSLSAGAEPDCCAAGSAWLSTDPGYEGYWKYCYEITWSGLPHGVSHLDFFLKLDDCACVCTPGYFAFDDTVGAGPGGNGDPCTVNYYAEFSCDGDPSVDVYTPLIKFEPFEGDCEPDHDGVAYLCFYSVAAPIPAGIYPDVIGIKFGPYSDTGHLDGVMPSCDTDASATENTSWGKVKALYR